MTSALATRLCGSDDLYGGRGPLHSINFICCHDGFTLYDLVSYNHKHNEANGEGNRDGNDANWSWNCGAEGPTDDPGGEPAPRAAGAQPDGDAAGLPGRAHDPGRRRVPAHPEGQQQRLVPGQPHELGRLVAARIATPGFLRFVADDDRLPQGARHPAAADVLHGRPRAGRPEILWHGVEPAQPDFSPTSQSLAFALDGRYCDRPATLDRDIYVAMNSGNRPLEFKIPASPSGRGWRRLVDTTLPSPQDIVDDGEGPRIPILHPYRVAEHSLIILVSDA